MNECNLCLMPLFFTAICTIICSCINMVRKQKRQMHGCRVCKKPIDLCSLPFGPCCFCSVTTTQQKYIRKLWGLQHMNPDDAVVRHLMHFDRPAAGIGCRRSLLGHSQEGGPGHPPDNRCLVPVPNRGAVNREKNFVLTRTTGASTHSIWKAS